jgi:hypothetical protein
MERYMIDPFYVEDFAVIFPSKVPIVCDTGSGRFYLSWEVGFTVMFESVNGWVVCRDEFKKEVLFGDN